jgi:hypothetical protein
MERTVNPVAVYSAHHGCQHQAATGSMPQLPVGTLRRIEAVLFAGEVRQGSFGSSKAKTIIIPSVWEFEVVV